MTISVLQPEAVDAMRPFFVGRNEPNFSWQIAVSSHLFLPRVSGLWTSVIGASNTMTDMTGNGQTMTPTGSGVPYYLDFSPVFTIPNNSSYFSTPDAAINSFGDFYFVGWVRFSSAGATQGVINKWGAAGNKSFRFYKNSSNQMQFEVSEDGTATTSLTHTGATLEANTWYHVVANFISATGASIMRIWVNGTVEETTTGLSGLFNNTTTMQIGRASNGTNDGLIGYGSLFTVGWSDLPDLYVKTMYQYEKALYGYN